jgi:hypothetical protein
MRSDEWLEEQLFEIWENYFADVPRQNIVLINFGKRSKRQLGCIKKLHQAPTKKLAQKAQSITYTDDKSISLIIITSYFKDEAIPEFIVRTTIAHELCHYTHGFNSPLPKLFDSPHAGGIIRKELTKREMGDELKIANKWLKTNWANYLRSQISR